MKFIYLNPYKSLCSFFDESGAGGGGGDVKPEKQNLTQVIEDAAVTIAKQVGDEIKKEEEAKPDVKEEKVEEKDKKETKKEEEKTEEELTPEQQVFAKTLYKALNHKDINVQRETLEILSKAAGFKLESVETKKEVTEATETLLDLLKAGLGEYDFLAEKLSPVLEKAMKRIAAEETKQTKEELRELKLEKQKELVQTGIQTAFNEFEDSASLAPTVQALQADYPYNPKSGKTITQYFRGLILMAAGEKGITLTKAGTKPVVKEVDKARVDRNRQDVATRLSTERGVEAKLGVKIPGKVSLTTAVTEAIEELASKT